MRIVAVALGHLSGATLSAIFCDALPPRNAFQGPSARVEAHLGPLCGALLLPQRLIETLLQTSRFSSDPTELLLGGSWDSAPPSRAPYEAFFGQKGRNAV